MPGADPAAREAQTGLPGAQGPYRRRFYVPEVRRGPYRRRFLRPKPRRRSPAASARAGAGPSIYVPGSDALDTAT